MNREFEEFTLEEVLDRVIGGGTPSRDVVDYYTGDIPWATVKDLKSTQLFDTLEHITSDAVQNSAANVVPAGTVVMATRMAVGKCFIAMVDMAINQDLKALFPKRDQLFAEYLMNWLEYQQGVIDAMGTGTTVKGIRLEQLKSMRIALPPLSEQRKIVAILSSVDGAITATQRIIDQIEVVKRGLMQQLLTKGIGHTTFKQTEIGEIPTKWDVCTFEELLHQGSIQGIQDGNHGELHPKASDYVESGIPFIMANDLKEGTLDLCNCKLIEKQQADKLRIGFAKSADVLLTHKGTIGYVAIVPEVDEYIMLTPQVTYYRVSKGGLLNNKYLYYFFQSPPFQSVLQRLSAQSTRAYIGITNQKKLSIAIPSLEEQNRIVSVLSTVDDKLRVEKQTLNNFQTVKSALMQVLLTGKIRVNVDEPSEVSV